MALRVTQTPVEVVLDQDPAIRVTQAPVEVVLDQDPNLRVTQVAVEAVFLEGHLRVTQLATEVVIGGPESGAWPPTEGQVSQLAVEVATRRSAPARISHFVAEVAAETHAPARVSQFALEFAQIYAADARVSNLAVEVLHGTAALTRVSQLVVEVLFERIDTSVPNQPGGQCLCPADSAVSACPVHGASTVGACDEPEASSVSGICPTDSSLSTDCAEASSVEIPDPPDSTVC